MTAKTSVTDAPLAWLQEQLVSVSPELHRAVINSFVQALMSAEADALCGAPYGERSQPTPAGGPAAAGHTAAASSPRHRLAPPAGEPVDSATRKA